MVYKLPTKEESEVKEKNKGLKKIRKETVGVLVKPMWGGKKKSCIREGEGKKGRGVPRCLQDLQATAPSSAPSRNVGEKIKTLERKEWKGREEGRGPSARSVSLLRRPRKFRKKNRARHVST